MTHRAHGNRAPEELARASATPTRNVSGGVDEVASRDIELANVAFTDILGIDIKPEWRGGLVRVAGHVRSGAVSPFAGNSFLYAYIDVRVVGYVGSKPESIHRAAFGADSGAIDVVIEAVQAYRRIAVLARLVVDGVTDRVRAPVVGDTPHATASAIARFVR